ncbi:MAG: HlyD family efflux transporter periplasmic adaptor subunit [Burkholderiales bacterium]|nr:HlyD family efflux transporter periplasmic adaptor subunit [Burkholderiales bacterium]
MSQSLFSPSWYRVAELTPRLRAHAQIHRQEYRGETWYVLQDAASERYHRFAPAAHYLIGLMDGRRTVQMIWDLALRKLGDDALSQDELIQLLSQLHTADVLQCDVPPDTQEMFRRREQVRAKKWQQRLMSVFAWQIPLVDPERFLSALLPPVRSAFTAVGFAVWLIVVCGAALVAGAHWSELTQGTLDQMLAPRNLVMLWLLFPVVKALHELGHGFAVKAFGGEVHEMGIMILVLTPVPYVDASAAWAFRSKWQRVVVGAAGMAIELVVAAIALTIWVNAEPGTVRSLAHNTMVIAGVSTLLFNANPLLRFDGYYMLMDFLEIPNLRTRANQYLAYLAERTLFGREDSEPPVSTPGERAWFVGFSVASFIYRILVVLAILVYVGEVSLLLGVIFAVMTATMWFLLPAFKIVDYLAHSPRIRRVRSRAMVASGLVVAGIALALFALPMPQRTMTEGVVWVPEEGLVRAGADGFVQKVLAKPGDWVKRGAPLLEIYDRDLAAEVQVLEARLQELQARHREQVVLDRVKAQILEEEMGYVRSKLARAHERTGDLTVTAGADGRFVLPRASDLLGRYVRKGELVAHVVNIETVTVRAVVPQEDIDLVRSETRRVDVRLAEHLAGTVRAELTRLVPGASEQLPSAALGTAGGGHVAVDPTDSSGKKAVQKFFQVDLELPQGSRTPNVGGRVYVRFHHGWAPIAFQWYREARQLFLARFNV